MGQKVYNHPDATHAKHKKRGINWTVWFAGWMIALLIAVAVVALSGEMITGEMITGASFFWWIYLSIRAWKVWKWKSLIPYPLQMILSAFVMLAMGWDVEDYVDLIAISLTFNVGGIILFYLAVKRSEKKEVLR